MSDASALINGSEDEEEDEQEQAQQLPLCLRFHSLITGCLILVFFFIGVLVGMHNEGWTFLTSLYVITQIVTTVGYGDVTVRTDTVRIFYTFYVLGLICFGASVINDVGEAIVDREQNLMRDYMRELTDDRKAGKRPKRSITWSRRLHVNSLVGSILIFFSFAVFGTTFYATYEACSCSYGHTLTSPNCTDVGAASNCAPHNGTAAEGETKDFAEAFYMSVITLTTVGFGDFTPLSKLGRGLGIVWMFLGVLATGNMVSCISATLTAMKKQKKSQLQVSRDILTKIDDAGTGGLTRSQFLQYIMVKHNMVQQEDIDRIIALFDATDKDKNGFLSIAEIEEDFAHDEEN